MEKIKKISIGIISLMILTILFQFGNNVKAEIIESDYQHYLTDDTMTKTFDKTNSLYQLSNKTNNYQNLLTNKSIYTESSYYLRPLDLGIECFNSTSKSKYAFMENYYEFYNDTIDYQSTTTDGTYNSTYSFTSDTYNSNPSGWTTTEPSSTSVFVSDYLYNSLVCKSLEHKKVVELDDNSVSGSCDIYQTIPQKNFANISYWISMNDVSKSFSIDLMKDTTFIMENGIAGSFIYSYNTISTQHLPVVNNQWYHIIIGLNSLTFKYNVSVNGILVISNKAYANNQIPNKIIFQTSGSLSGYSCFVDSIDYSWSPQFYLYRNAKPLSLTKIFDNFQTCYNYFKLFTFAGSYIQTFTIYYQFYLNKTKIYYFLGTNPYIVQTINYKRILDVDIKAHIRYGLSYDNTNENCLNILIDITYNLTTNSTLNYKLYNKYYLTLSEFYIQPNFNYYGTPFWYDSIGNTKGFGSYYRVNNLRGFRCFKAYIDKNYDNFFIVPNFRDLITLVIPPEPLGPDIIPDKLDEPDNPKGSNKYWKYDSYILQSIGTTDIHFESLKVIGSAFDVIIDYNFNNLEAIKENGRFYYSDETFTTKELGDWSFKINIGLGDFKINLNWFRMIIRTILNTIMVFLQFILFLLVVALNYIVMFFIVGIIVCWLYNFILFWILYGLLCIMFGICILLVILLWSLWLLLIVLYIVLIVIFDWFINVALIPLVNIIIIAFSFVLAIIIYAVSFGSVDFDDTYQMVLEMNTQIALFLIQTFNIFINNITGMLFYILSYVLITLLCFLKQIYVKAKGNVERTEQLENSFSAYSYPIIKVYNFMVKVKDFIKWW